MAFFLIRSAFLLFQVLISLLKLKKSNFKRNLLYTTKDATSEHLIPVTVIIPVYNNEEDIIKTVENLLVTQYPQIEFLIVNDGSTDNTADTVIPYFGFEKIEGSVKVSMRTERITALYCSEKIPNLLYIEKTHGGIADAINCGINISKFPAYTVVSPGFFVDKYAVMKLSDIFLKNSSTIISAGVLRVTKSDEDGNLVEFKKLTDCFTALECVKTSFLDKFNNFHYATQFNDAGSFALFNKQTVVDCGGYDTNVLNPHYDLFIRLRAFQLVNNRSCDFVCSQDVVCQTDIDVNKKSFLKRLGRWQRAAGENIIKGVVPTFFKKFDLHLLAAFFYNLFFEVLYPVFSAVFVLTLPVLALNNKVSFYISIMCCVTLIFLDVVISLFCLIFDQYFNESNSKLSLKYGFCTVLMNLGYKQLMLLRRFLSIFSSKKRYRK